MCFSYLFVTEWSFKKSAGFTNIEKTHGKVLIDYIYLFQGQNHN